MRVLVTGGAGFQGSNLSRELLAQQHRVTILSTRSDRSELNLIRFGLGEATVVWGSITDRDLVDKTVREHDLVYHLAANIHVDQSIADPAAFVRTNVFGTYNVLEACRKHRAALLHVSSCEVYGCCDSCPDLLFCPKRRRISEGCPLKPHSPYAATKAGAETLAWSYGMTYGLPVLIVRPGNVFGPGQRYGTRGAVIPIFLRRALRGEDLVVYGDGAQRRDFVHVEDLVRAYAALGATVLGSSGPQVLNISSGESIAVRDLAELIVGLTGSTSRIVYRDPRPGEVGAFGLDGSRLLKTIPFQFGPPLRQRLAEYVPWFVEHEMTGGE